MLAFKKFVLVNFKCCKRRDTDELRQFIPETRREK